MAHLKKRSICIAMSIFLGFVAFSLKAQANSIDCKKISHETEKIICSDPALIAKDKDIDALFSYRSYRWNADDAERKRLRIEQRHWIKNERNRCENAKCIDAAYDKRIAQLTIRDIHADWDTDGYWYFLAKKPLKGDAFALAYIANNGADVLLTSTTNAGIWINQKRIMETDEKRHMLDTTMSPSIYRPTSFCDMVSLDSVWDQSPKFNDPTNDRIILKDQQGKVIRSLSILQKVDPPEKIEGVLREDHEDITAPFLLPIESPGYPIAVLSDCTLIVELKNGIIRFDSEGKTKAPIPSDMRIVDAVVLDQLEHDFHLTKEYRGDEENSLESKLWFFLSPFI